MDVPVFFTLTTLFISITAQPFLIECDLTKTWDEMVSSTCNHLPNGAAINVTQTKNLFYELALVEDCLYLELQKVKSVNFLRNTLLKESCQNSVIDKTNSSCLPHNELEFLKKKNIITNVKPCEISNTFDGDVIIRGKRYETLDISNYLHLDKPSYILIEYCILESLDFLGSITAVLSKGPKDNAIIIRNNIFINKVEKIFEKVAKQMERPALIHIENNYNMNLTETTKKRLKQIAKKGSFIYVEPEMKKQSPTETPTDNAMKAQPYYIGAGLMILFTITIIVIFCLHSKEFEKTEELDSPYSPFRDWKEFGLINDLYKSDSESEVDESVKNKEKDDDDSNWLESSEDSDEELLDERLKERILADKLNKMTNSYRLS